MVKESIKSFVRPLYYKVEIKKALDRISEDKGSLSWGGLNKACRRAAYIDDEESFVKLLNQYDPALGVFEQEDAKFIFGGASKNCINAYRIFSGKQGLEFEKFYKKGSVEWIRFSAFYQAKKHFGLPLKVPELVEVNIGDRLTSVSTSYEGDRARSPLGTRNDLLTTKAIEILNVATKYQKQIKNWWQREGYGKFLGHKSDTIFIKSRLAAISQASSKDELLNLERVDREFSRSPRLIAHGDISINKYIR